MGGIDDGLAPFGDGARFAAFQGVVPGELAVGADGDEREHRAAGVLGGDAIGIVDVFVEVGVAVGAVHQLRDLDRLVGPHAADRVFLRRGERGVFVERGEGGWRGLCR